MRLEADWLSAEETQQAFRLLSDAGHAVYAVGGCVRNTLLGEPVKDIDFATDAPPDRIMELAGIAEMRAVPTGIDHGTVTIVINHQPFEITTFRQDVETDGRRAVVAFSDNIADDAFRRDFTINALYCDAEGNVLDPSEQGLADIVDRRLRFVGDANERVCEDHLRSLRYFRFHAWYADPKQGFDEVALDAISSNLEGLAKLSRERVGSEVMRLLEAPDPAFAVAGMRTTGVLPAILPGADDSALGPLVSLEAEAGFAPEPLRRLGAMGGGIALDDLRLSRKDASRLAELERWLGAKPSELGYRLGREMAADALLLTWAKLSAPLSRNDLEKAAHGSRQRFPVKAADLMPDIQGEELGKVLKRLEQLWIDSDFVLSKEQLIVRAKG